jgi:hypothetical protein
VPLQADFLTLLVGFAASASTLSIVEFSGCQITGLLNYFDAMPFEVISHFDMSDNEIEGYLYWAYCSAMQYIDLSNNQLYGKIVGDFCSLLVGDPITGLQGCPLVYFANFSSNPDIEAPGGDLPSFLTYDYSELSFNTTAHTQCASVEGAVRLIQVVFDRSYVDYGGCQCTSEYRRMNGTCQDCPLHGK